MSEILQIKITFSAQLLRANAEVEGAFLLSHQEPPTAFWERVYKKMEAAQSAGKIAGFKLYRDEWSLFWQEAHRSFISGGQPLDTYCIPLAQAWPPQLDISVKQHDDPAIAFVVSARLPDSFCKKVSESSVVAYVENLAAQKGIIKRANQGQIHAFWLWMQQLGQVEDMSIATHPERLNEKPLQLMANSLRGDVVAVVHDAKILHSDTAHRNLLKIVIDTTQKLKSQSGLALEVFKQSTLERIEEASRGYQAVGFDLPLCILVACVQRPVKSQVKQQDQRTSALNSDKNQDSPRIETANESMDVYPGRGLLEISIIDDGMEASVDLWDMSNYEDLRLRLDRDWLERELRRLGVVFGYERSLGTILVALSRKQDVSGLLIAKGRPASAAQDPYIFQTYRQFKSSGESKGSVRDRQQRSIVMPGDLVAEVRYRKPAEQGMDVLGRIIEPPPAAELEVTVGEGVRQDGHKFYSEIEGSPDISNLNITVNDRFVLKEDVNLRTGNIYFGGNATIEGCIDQGATVEVKGNLLVKGTIRAAYVRVGGNLIVEQGIVTTERGRVMCYGDLTCEFIHNSSIVTSGNITVKKAILSSRVRCGDSIVLDENEGVIAGGILSARNFVKTAKLGLPEGIRTRISVGSDAELEHAISIREGRLEKVKLKNEEARLELRTLTRKRQKVQTTKLDEQISSYTQYLQKSRRVIDCLNQKIKELYSHLKYDNSAQIMVFQEIATTCDIIVAGNIVPVLKEESFVLVKAHKRSGASIVALESKAKTKKAS